MKDRYYRMPSINIDADTGEVIDVSEWKCVKIHSEEKYEQCATGWKRQTVNIYQTYGKKEKQLSLF